LYSPVGDRFAPKHRESPRVAVVQDLDNLCVFVGCPEVPFIDDEGASERVRIRKIGETDDAPLAKIGL
jgi:hypothetical protein